MKKENRTEMMKKDMGKHMAGKKRLLAALMMGAALVSSMPVMAEEADGEPIRVGAILALGTAMPFVSQQQGYFDEAGLEVEVLEFSDGAAVMEAFAAGELDLALVGIGPAATWFTKGIDLKVVAGTNGGGHVLMTRADSEIETVADLNSALVAEPNISTVTDALLRSKILPDAGLDPDMDVVLIPGMKPADMASSLMATQEVDAMITWEPYASQAELQYGDKIRVLYDAASELAAESGEEGAFYPGNVVIASGDFIENKKDKLDSYLETHKKAVEYINTDNGANALLASILQLDETVIENARKRVDFHSEVDVDASKEVLSWSVDLGYLKELPDETEFFLNETQS